ncbi:MULTISPECIES: FtsH protease activity modulator HflK [unclassified Rhizobium]|uniref:FtsH protease activity modulator HflK n=1 Tax=unclassified Rhizobium TaxID=2613769 RepID=UPI0007EBCA25|nr:MULTISPECIES: FtsH protease activity modulator HflK [unclassified Rhizobium]ANM11301.1 protein HflK [Rhizobium sp. N324]ANM17846.1 protein HflK [Rhizobium sp. N541]ANM24232.1 protein HflK [Rhizobium sp. N941]OWV74144.1 phage tail protein [Rhizobium sp. N122]OYD04902.1 protein HflK [Rhizobium sp. N4311]
MPWSNQNGGGGPWGGGGGNNQGPWGQGPNRPRGGGSGKGGPPDLEDIIRRGQDQLRNIVPGGFNGGVAVIVAAVVAVFWLIQCVYVVQPDERGVELRFGKPKEEISMPGLHFHFWPMESVETVKVTVQQLNIGATSASSSNGLMLSSDKSVINVQFAVFYTVSDPKAYLFNVENPAETLQQVSDSAMREIVGRRPAQDAFRSNRQPIEVDVLNIVQDTMNRYGAGVTVTGVTIQNVAPPREVADAFEEVQRAGRDRDSTIEDANRYTNQKLGQARGDAARIREDAAAYKNRVVKEAEGEAQRFTAINDEYSKAPEVTRKRLFIETMEQVLKNSKKVIIDEKQGVLPYLPLNEIGKPAQQGG